MTKKELIKALEELKDDDEICIECEDGLLPIYSTETFYEFDGSIGLMLQVEEQ